MSKSCPRPSEFNTFDCRRASRPNNQHFFNISMSKSGSTPSVFKHFWLVNVFRATAAYTFSISPLPKVVRTSAVFNMFTSTCALRHGCVQFLISHLPRWLRTHRFGEPTFRPSGTRNKWKRHGVLQRSYLFVHLRLLSDFFSSLISFLFFSLLWPFPPPLFHLVILWEVWLLNTLP